MMKRNGRSLAGSSLAVLLLLLFGVEMCKGMVENNNSTSLTVTPNMKIVRENIRGAVGGGGSSYEEKKKKKKRKFEPTLMGELMARSGKGGLRAAGRQLAGAPVAGMEFCWLNTYGRGVGRVPRGCGEDKEKVGLFCYEKCPSGMDRSGTGSGKTPDCYSKCPSGTTDIGLMCVFGNGMLDWFGNTRGRGAGYEYSIWKSKGPKRRCERDHGNGNCEKCLALWYPKCTAKFGSGWAPSGCNLCRKKAADCGKYNLNDSGAYNQCYKKIKTGVIAGTGTCGEGKEKDAGLCYKKCKTGYTGHGPVCWGKEPEGYVNCGMGAAINDLYCGTTISSQVVAVSYMVGLNALHATSFGASLSITPAANFGMANAQLGYYLVNAWWLFIAISAVAYGANWIYTVTNLIMDAEERGEIDPALTVRLIATVLSVADPSGTYAVIAAFSYGNCAKVISAQAEDADISSRVVVLQSLQHQTFLTRNQDEVQTMERASVINEWTLTQHADGKYSLRSWDDKLLRVKSDGTVDLKVGGRGNYESFEKVSVNGDDEHPNFYLKSYHDTYLRSEPNGQVSAVSSNGGWAKWTTLTPGLPIRAALRSYHNTYLWVDETEEDPEFHFIPGSMKAQQWEIIALPDETFALRVDGLYLQADPSGQTGLTDKESYASLGAWEKFTMIPHNGDPSKVYFKSSHMNRFLMAHDTGNLRTSSNQLSWERFDIQFSSSRQVPMKTWHNTYLGAFDDLEHGDRVEYWTMTKHIGGKFTLQAYNGHYLRAKSDGSVDLKDGEPAEWEMFRQITSDNFAPKFYLETHHGRLLKANSDGQVQTQAKTFQSWERWEIPPEPIEVTVQSHHARYLFPYDTTAVQAWSQATWIFARGFDGKFTLQANSNNKYLGISDTGSIVMSDGPGSWETLELIPYQESQCIFYIKAKSGKKLKANSDKSSVTVTTNQASYERWRFSSC